MSEHARYSCMLISVHVVPGGENGLLPLIGLVLGCRSMPELARRMKLPSDEVRVWRIGLRGNCTSEVDWIVIDTGDEPTDASMVKVRR